MQAAQPVERLEPSLSVFSRWRRFVLLLELANRTGIQSAWLTSAERAGVSRCWLRRVAVELAPEARLRQTF